MVGDGVLFNVWAPKHKAVTLVLDDDGERSMKARGDGYFELHVPHIGDGTRYWFEFGNKRWPDPISRFQPEGVFGPSMVVDAARFQWTDAAWKGAPPAHRNVVYEMHVGTLTREGTWAAAQERLPELAALGITTLEVLPIAEFSGRFGWGYDGVFMFAPFHRYGMPDDARRFIDAAHEHGLAVILDVVYNHTGPIGCVLHEFSDHYYSSYKSDWGQGFNLDGPKSAPVREFMKENVRQWIEDYHFDGLRFDAVHAIMDFSEHHILDELSLEVTRAANGRRVFMVAENECQDVWILNAGENRRGGVDAIWNEDWHHAAFVALTGRREAYFTDYWGTAQEFASMTRWNLLYQGQWYSWQNQGRGTDSRDLPGASFVSFLENHDQVANTGFGERLQHVVDPGLWRAMTSLLLLGPGIPMLFQGQERASRAPFTYFCDHEPPLADAVRSGRLEFLAQFLSFRDPDLKARLVDPCDETAFHRCHLDWQETPESVRALKLHGDLLRLRRDDAVLKHLGTKALDIQTSAPSPSILIVRYRAAGDERLLLLNLGERTTFRMNDPLLAAPRGLQWTRLWCSDHVDYGGRGIVDAFVPGLWDLQAHCAWLLSLTRRAD
jgi:maltooligosyltrehalose trehalohydrolase